MARRDWLVPHVAAATACALVAIMAACEGPEGPMGPQGDEGPEGPRGPTGSRGSQGAQGESPDLSTVEEEITELQARLDSLAAVVASVDAGDPTPGEPPDTPLGSVDDLEGAIPGLTGQSMYAWVADWDADADDDGVQILISYKDAQGSTLFWDDAVVSATAELFVATAPFSKTKKALEPYYRQTFILRSSAIPILIAFEDFSPSVPAADTYYSSFDQSDVVDTVVEVTVTVADGSTFSSLFAMVLLVI